MNVLTHSSLAITTEQEKATSKLVYLLANDSALVKFLAICERSERAFETQRVSLKLLSSCRPIRPQSNCHRHFSLLSYGVAGNFLDEDAKMIEDCIGADSILLVEKDEVVVKDADDLNHSNIKVESASAPKVRATSKPSIENSDLDISILLSGEYLPYDKPIVMKYDKDETSPQGNQTLHKALWNLDRIDQQELPLTGTFSFHNKGKGVNAYVLDSGIRRTHKEFQDNDAKYLMIKYI